MAEKPVLRFNGDGKFRILMISDFHSARNKKLPEDYNYKMIKGIDALMDETKPDFVMVGGDQVIDASTTEEAEKIMAGLMAPVISRSVPWAAVFGNHDNEYGLPTAEEEKSYMALPFCLNEVQDESLDGAGNFRLQIKDKAGESVVFNIFALDSHREITDLIDKFGLPEDTRIVLPHHFNEGQTGCAADFEQVMWYYNTSKEDEKKAGKKIPAVMFMHIPLPEYLEITRNPEHCGAIGSKRETLGASEINFGLFGACLQRGDVKGIFFGHEHLCDIQGTYCGITMAQDAAIGYNMSAHDDLRGGRVIDLYDDGTLETKTVKLIDLLGKEAMRRPDYFEGGCKYFIRDL